MQINPTNTSTKNTLPVTSAAHYTPVLLAALVGTVLLFVAGFAETHVLHSAAHDSRHAVVFPCH